MAKKPDRTKISITDEASLSLLRRVVRDLVRPYTGRLVLAVLCMVLVAAATAASAWLMDPIVNKIFIEKDLSVLWLVAGAVVATFFVKSVATYIQEVLVGYVGQRVVADTQARLYRHLIHLDLRSEEHTSELQSHHDLVCRLLLEKKNKKQAYHVKTHTKPTTVIAIEHESQHLT